MPILLTLLNSKIPPYYTYRWQFSGGISGKILTINVSNAFRNTFLVTLSGSSGGAGTLWFIDTYGPTEGLLQQIAGVNNGYQLTRVDSDYRKFNISAGPDSLCVMALFQGNLKQDMVTVS